jgi:hypothetical protein
MRQEVEGHRLMETIVAGFGKRKKNDSFHSSNLSDFYGLNNVNDLEGLTVYRKFRARQSCDDVALILLKKRTDHVLVEFHF